MLKRLPPSRCCTREARKQKETAFFELAERFRESDDPKQVKQLGDELGRFVFAE